MQWNDIRKHYPNQWLLLEALKAHTEGNQRVLEQLAIVAAYSDSQSALDGAMPSCIVTRRRANSMYFTPVANGWA
jgi:hypothetical protein